jgi:acetyl esterase
MPLDPQTQTLLERLKAIDFRLTRGLTPMQVRARQRALAQFTAPRQAEPVARIEHRSIPGPVGDIPLRIYCPQESGPFPILLYFHSGGGVIGDLDSEDGLCRRLTNQVGCLVVSVDYRLAPEYKFPVGQEECYTATCWAAEHAVDFDGTATNIALGGLSAGASLAASVAHMARDRGGPTLVFQLLLAPLTDFRLRETASFVEYALGYMLTREDIFWFINHCLENEADRLNPLASPYLAPTLAGLPPALIVTAEYDPLRDDGEEYGKRLREAGVPVTISRRAGAIHCFIVPYQLDLVLAESAAALRAAFGTLQADNTGNEHLPLVPLS